MSQTLIQVRVDKTLKEQTAAIYDAIGIDLPTAIRMFFKRSVMVGGLPFEGRIVAPERNTGKDRAFAAFDAMRAKVLATPGDEPTMDDINGFIASVRRTRMAQSSAAENQE